MTTATAVKTWDFSFRVHDPAGKPLSPKERTFRFRADDGEELYADKALGFEGTAYIESSNGKTGHMTVKCAIERLESGLWVTYLDEDFKAGIVVPEGADYADYWQVCFNRAGENWRIWDKAQRPTTLKFTSGYQGPVYWSWHDGGGHVFVHGRKWDQGGVVMFAGDRP
jgi:hypothetical protein